MPLHSSTLVSIVSTLQVGGIASLSFPLIEKTTVDKIVTEIGDRCHTTILRWDFLNGLLGDIKLDGGDSYVEQLVAISTVLTANAKAKHLYVFENISPILEGASSEETERLRLALVRILIQLRAVDSYLLLLDDRGGFLPRDIKQVVSEFFLPLPNYEEIQEILVELGVSPEQKLIEIGLGLTSEEIKRGLRLAQLSGGDPATELRSYKVDRLKSLGLEFLGVPDVASFGGLDVIRDLLVGIKKDLSPAARKFNIPPPRGWFFVGPPGTGKTHAAKCIATELGVPLISIGIDMIKSGGAAALKALLERLNLMRCVIYIDELDKFFNENVDTQINGVLLTWMQERSLKTGNFLLATLNRLSNIPPELMRPGRVDGVYWIGFPQNNEKYEIIKIYAELYDDAFKKEFGRLSHEEWMIIMNMTTNFTGSELKLLVENAVRKCFHDMEETGLTKIEITYDLLMAVRSTVTSLYARNTDAILNIINQAKSVTTPASSEDVSIFKTKTVNVFGDPDVV